MPRYPSRLDDRYACVLLGLACGDAVGATSEFLDRDSFPPVTDMVGGGLHQLVAGQWTDDTSMAMCLAESLLAHEAFNPVDQLGIGVRSCLLPNRLFSLEQYWALGTRIHTGA